MRSNRELNRFARKLRRNQTKAERRMAGLWFLSFWPQRVTPKRFIADYYSPLLGVIVELDGGVHDYQKGRDADRDKAHWRRGIYTIRLSNDTALKRRPIAFFMVIYLALCFQLVRPWLGWRKRRRG